MSYKERLHRQLLNARNISEKLLEAFQSPEHWVHQLYPGSNHALWFAGHMTQVDNFLIGLVDPARAIKLPGYVESFGMGSQPVAEAGSYPPPAEVLENMRERRRSLLQLLETLSDEDLAKPTPKGAPSFIPDFGAVFETAIWHEGVHSGQLTHVRRALGHKPILGAG